MEIDLYPKYQKIVDVSKGSPLGYEATVQGINGESALDLFSRAKREGSIVELDRKARFLTIQASKGIVKDGEYLFINVANESVEDSILDFPLISWKSNIVLEITEHIKVTDNMVTNFKKMHDLGYLLALDDFGSDYSNFDLYTKLPFSFLKLDKFFTNSIEDPLTYNAVKGLCYICEESGIKLIAEGIETKLQKDKLESIGVRYMQGYYFGKPFYKYVSNKDNDDGQSSVLRRKAF